VPHLHSKPLLSAVFLRFIDVDIDTERQMVLKRHISKGMGSFSVFTGYCSYSSTRERKEILVILIPSCLTGKPPDVSKWRVSLTLLSSSNLVFFWIAGFSTSILFLDCKCVMWN
jgi:hypothetical protein